MSTKHRNSTRNPANGSTARMGGPEKNRIDHVFALPEGCNLKEYTLTGTLGIGGFGITYSAYDNNLEKIVAIKEYIPSELAARIDGNTVSAKSEQDRECFEWGRERFLDEARIVAKFDHPNIIQIHRFFKQNGTGYIVMDFIEGSTLACVLKEQGTLEETEIRAWLWPVMDGLSAVHEAGYLHRDIKPQNIMMHNDGRPVLLDFGAARAAIGGHTLSLTAIMTPGYAPLEQYQTRSHQGPWTDIYALGAVMYRCVSGEKPEDALNRVSEDSLHSPTSESGKTYSTGLTTGITSALALKETERPQSLGEWLKILDFQREEPTRLLPTRREDTLESPGEKESERKADKEIRPQGPSNVRLFALVAIFLAVAAIYWLSPYYKDGIPQHSAVTIPAHTSDEQDTTSAKSGSDPTKLVWVSREIKAHPTRANRLRLKAKFKNSANTYQSFPTIEILLLDDNQRVVNTITAAPSRYLPGDVDFEAGMSPGESFTAIVDFPAPGRVGFLPGSGKSTEAPKFEISFR